MTLRRLRDTMAEPKKLKVTLLKSKLRPPEESQVPASRVSVSGRSARASTVLDTPENRGMINKVSYLVSVEEV